jgi:branched-chain amino acid transport system ATP-binding protein
MLFELKDVNAGYGGTQVLWGASVKCRDHSLVALVGSNGAGKSTLLRVANGLLKPTQGSVYYDGKDITALPAYERVKLGIASVSQGRGLFPNLSTEDNLRLGAYAKRARDYVEESLKFVYDFLPRLKDRAKIPAGRLSGGEQQMAGIGKALTSRPSLLLLDEPSLGLAPRLVTEILEKITELKVQGLGLLMVEQNAFRALEVCDYAYVLQEGRVIKSGTPSELMNDEELRKAYFSIT